MFHSAFRLYRVNLLAQTRVAEAKNLTRGTVSRACKGALAPAMVGKRIDTDHPAYLAWERSLAKRRGEPEPAPSPPAGPPTLTAYEPEFAASKDLLELTVREVAERYGAAPMFVDYLKAHRMLIDSIRAEVATEAARWKLAERQGELISTQTVQTAVLGHVDELHSRLLGDASLNLAQRMAGLVNAGAEWQEIRDIIAETIGRIMRDSKAKVLEALNDAISSYETDPDEPEIQDAA